jgi:flagellar biosynthesis protein FlhF
MTLRTFTGNTLKEALEAARRALGEDFYLVDSISPKTPGEPARVIVMIDEQRPARPRNPGSGTKTDFRSLLYQRQSSLTSASRTHSAPRPEASPPAAVRLGTGASSGPETVRPSGGLETIQRRLERLERLIRETLLEPPVEFVDLPLYRQLFAQGLPPALIHGWLREAVSSGIDPHRDPETFTWEVARRIRDGLPTAPARRPQTHIVFIGPAGVGKTSLIVKLARHPGFLAGRKIALLSLHPRDGEPVHNSLEALAERYRLPVLCVDSPTKMQKALELLEGFDHLLIDTPPVPLRGPETFRRLWQLAELLAGLVPMEVHWVQNATLHPHYADPGLWSRSPLPIDFIALTHLEELDRFGALYAMLRSWNRPVRFASTGRMIPDHLMAFSPAWLAEQLLQTRTPHMVALAEAS